MKIAWVVFAITVAGCQSRFLPPLDTSPNSVRLEAVLKSAASHYSVPVGLVRAVIMAESGGNPRAVSNAGAQGLMQLMPGTAITCGVTDAFDPFQNVDCGTRYLRQQLDRYGGNVRLSLAAYNAGPTAVTKYHGIPPYAETQAYVARVLAAYR